MELDQTGGNVVRGLAGGKTTVSPDSWRYCYAIDSVREETADSHFISETFNRGWETSRCHMTAWNDSVWGVTVSGFTVGTTTQASEIRAVNPPSRPTIPQILAPTCLANCSARTRLELILRSASPPPTEKTQTASCCRSWLPSSQLR